jgi:hypothetical protein
MMDLSKIISENKSFVLRNTASAKKRVQKKRSLSTNLQTREGNRRDSIFDVESKSLMK